MCLGSLGDGVSEHLESRWPRPLRLRSCTGELLPWELYRNRPRYCRSCAAAQSINKRPMFWRHLTLNIARLRRLNSATLCEISIYIGGKDLVCDRSNFF